MARKNVSFLITGGGTGGHLWPGVVLAQTIKSIISESKINFFVPGKQVDKNILATTNFPFFINPMRSFPSSLTQIESFATNFLKGWFETTRMFNLHKPDMIIALGGYGALSSGILANLYDIPLVAFESNSVAGRVVRWISPFCQSIYTQCEVARIDNKKVKMLGIPVRENLLISKEVSSNKRYFTILVMGGSQGALIINKTMTNSLPLLSDIKGLIKVVHLCGSDSERITQIYKEYGIDANVMSFSSNMSELYKESDLVVCRAGGSTIAELMAIGLPSILIPLEKAAENHQCHNGMMMERAKASIVIQEKDLTSERLAITIKSLINDADRLRSMAQNAKSLGKPDASYEIVLDILNILRNRK